MRWCMRRSDSIERVVKERQRSSWGISGPPRHGEYSGRAWKLNADGKAVAERKKLAHPGEWKKVEAAAAVLKKASRADYVKLSIAAKTYLMLGEKKGNATMQDLVDLASRFGWSVTRPQVEEAAAYLKSLGLVDLTTKC
jgi:hypothetical protein